MLIGYLPMFLFMPFIKKIVDRFGKQEACAVGSLVSVFGALLLFLPLGNGTIGLVGYVVAQVFFGLGLGFYTCVSWALMADAIDYNEWKHGTKEEGTVYSLHSFFRKLAQGLGPSLVVFIMGWLGYDGSKKADQEFWVAENMKWLVAALYTFSAIVMFVSIAFIYNLNKKRVAEMTEELKARRAALAGIAPEADAVVEAPVEEVPAEEAPIEDAPVEEAPAEDAPVEEAPAEDAPTEETKD